MMTNKLKRIGKSLMVEVPDGIVEHLGLEEGDILNFSVHGDSMLVAKKGQSEMKDFVDLVRKITDEHDEVFRALKDR